MIAMACSSTDGNVALYFAYSVATAVICAGVSSGNSSCAYCVMFVTAGFESTKYLPSKVFVIESRIFCSVVSKNHQSCARMMLNKEKIAPHYVCLFAVFVWAAL